MVLGRLPWRMSLSVFLFSERRGSEGELLSARGHMTALSDTCRLILRGLHTDAPCSTWQTLTCGLGPGRAPRAACYFAVTTGLLSWLLYWCSHAQTPSSPFSLGFSFTFVVFAASYFLRSWIKHGRRRCRTLKGVCFWTWCRSQTITGCFCLWLASKNFKCIYSPICPSKVQLQQSVWL